MLRSKRMYKMSVFGSRTFMKDVVDTLYDLNAVHVEEFSKKSEEEVFEIGRPFESGEKYAEMLVKLRSLISNLEIEKKRSKQKDTMLIPAIEKKAEELYDRISYLLSKKEYYNSLLELYERKDIKKSLYSLNIGGSHEDKSYFIGFVNEDPSTIKDEVENITKEFYIKSGNFESLRMIALFVDPKKTEKIQTILEKHNFSPVDIPVLKEHFSNLSGKAAQKFVKLDHQIEVIEKNIKDVNFKIDELKEDESDFLIYAEQKINMEVDKSSAPLKFGTTKNTFLIKGWIPQKNAETMKEKIDKNSKGNVIVKLEKPGKHDKVPTVYNHPKVVEPFEAFMDLYSLPKYKEIDPTFFMFLTFPFFFGMMLGDVVYGFITLGLFMFLKKKMPGAKHFLNAFIIASLVTILFGAAFGEYLGYEEVSPEIGEALGIKPKIIDHGSTSEIIYPIPHIFSRSHQISDLLSASILFGIVHIAIGLIIGFINIYKNHGFMHAMYEKGGWLMILPMMVWMLLNFLSIIKGYIGEMLSSILPSFGILAGLFAVGAILVIKGEGIRGLLEVLFLALLSNIMSYARLMAVGLASLSLAVVVNDMAGEMFHKGPGGIVAGIVILLIGHTINIALGILSPFLHSLRLHYVEFFTKFYSGGGKKFKAFGYNKNGT